MTIITKIPLTPEQIAWAESITFQYGAGDGVTTFCVEQAAAYLAGEPITDNPACACPVIRRGAMAVNDSWAWQGDDAARTTALRPVLYAQLGTRSTPEVEAARAMLARRFAVRVAAPFWLDKAGLTEEATALRGLTVTPETLTAVRDRCRQARDAAYAAAAAAANAAYAAYDDYAVAAAAAYAAYDDYAAAAAAAYAAAADYAAYAAYAAYARTMLTQYCGVLLAMCDVTPETAADVLANDRTEVSDG